MIAKAQLGILSETHPNATIWIAPQEWNSTQLKSWWSLVAQPEVSNN
jgi:hypothetical protein